MIKTNFLQSETNKVGCFESSEENEMFAKGLVSAISKGNDRISFTLTEKGAIAFARELSECILAENAAQASGKGGDDGTVLPKQEYCQNRRLWKLLESVLLLCGNGIRVDTWYLSRLAERCSIVKGT